ncbi:MAG: hypothetical protein J6B89_01250 [Bacilli bacterium]|nr:hypothetical protein [Bacilli bacterium]
MSGEKETKKENRSIIVLTIILLLGLLGTSGYIIYDKVLKNQSSTTIEEKNKKDNININDNDKNTEKNLDINSPGVQELYSKVSSNRDGHFSTAWMWPQQDKIIANELDEASKMKLVYINVKKDRMSSLNCSTIVPQSIDQKFMACPSGESNSIIYSIDKAEIERIYKDIFGKNATLDTSVNIETHEISVEKYSYVPSIDKYVLYTFAGGGTIGKSTTKTLTKATKIGDEIKIYEELTNFDLDEKIGTEQYVYTFKLEDDIHYYFYSREKIQ